MNRLLLDPAPTWTAPPPADPLAGALAALTPISLAQMEHVALLDRTDTKFGLTPAQVTQALTRLRDAYWVLEVDGRRCSAYQTLYFDTPDLALFSAHHAGRRHYCKVRSRSYVESDLAFFEVKVKTGPDHTRKHRLPTAELLTALTPEARALVSRHLPSGQPLTPTLWNEYRRITLVSRTGRERVTLDLDLRFERPNGRGTGLPGVVAAEVKQAGRDRQSPFMQLMRQWGVRRRGFSKYCVGVSLLYPEVKHNNFMPKLRRLAGLAQGASHGAH